MDRQDVTGGRLLALALAALAATAAGLPALASAQEAPDAPETFAVTQGEACVEVRPLGDGTRTVSAFYDYEGAPAYASQGTRDLQISDVSQLFVYRGSEGLSLVILNDRLGDGTEGGSATFFFRGLPAEREWVVQDDDFPGSEDEFDHRGTSSRIYWVWGENSSDGAAVRGLGADDYEAVTVNPMFSDDPDHVRAWGVRSADGTVYRLDRDESVSVRPGTCDGSPPTATPTTTTPATTDRPTTPDTTTRSPTPSSGPLSVVEVSTNRSTVAVGEGVAVTATVENTGDRELTYEAELATLGEVVATRTVTVPAGGTATVSFAHAFDAPGTYALAVGGARTQVHVDAAPATPGTVQTATGGPGFGTGLAVLALAAVGLLARRR